MSAAAPVASPCAGTCRLDGCGRLCEGCLRTIDEIAAWSQASEAQKLAILARVARRRAEVGNVACGKPDRS